MHTQNLHTHTVYCDGADTPEELITAALSKGFDSLGFSGHAYMSYSTYFQGIGDRTDEYKKEVKRLKKEYQDIIKLYLGLEVDMYSGVDMADYDYLIGSVHYLKSGDQYVGFDRGQQEVENVIHTYFNGNGMEYAKSYYKTLATLPEYGDFDIVGHFDIISKHSDRITFFDETSKEYLHAAFEAIEALANRIPFFEVNTGTIARGYRTSPYPSIPIIKELKRRGFGAVITSDCHNKNMLDCYFDEATELLRICGFKEKYILTDQGFTAVSL